jgi:hypothetical protein
MASAYHPERIQPAIREDREDPIGAGRYRLAHLDHFMLLFVFAAGSRCVRSHAGSGGKRWAISGEYPLDGGEDGARPGSNRNAANKDARRPGYAAGNRALGDERRPGQVGALAVVSANSGSVMWNMPASEAAWVEYPVVDTASRKSMGWRTFMPTMLPTGRLPGFGPAA